jgi:hypothetical protein
MPCWLSEVPKLGFTRSFVYDGCVRIFPLTWIRRHQPRGQPPAAYSQGEDDKTDVVDAMVEIIVMRKS